VTWPDLNSYARKLQRMAVSEVSLNLGNGTEDHTQQEREEAVVGNVVHAPKDYEDHKNQLCPFWEFICGP
jgi:hypothetical protein